MKEEAHEEKAEEKAEELVEIEEYPQLPNAEIEAVKEAEHV